MAGEETNIPVSGAKIGIYAEDKTTKLAELITDANGQVDFTREVNLEAGTTYYYKEKNSY